MSSIVYIQKLLSVMDIVPIPMENNQVSDFSLQKAVTANENLLSLGYSLLPQDIINLSKSPVLDDFCRYFNILTGKVTAKTLYPDYPHSLMDFSRAGFRFKQLAKHFAFYNQDNKAKNNLPESWIPADEEQINIEDHKLRDARIIHLLSKENQYIEPVNRIICEKGTVTEKKRSIVRDAVSNMLPKEIGMLNISQKDQLMLIFSQIVCSENNPSKFDQLLALCKNTEDVLLGIDFTLTYVDYHFHTSQKKLLTKLLESYPGNDFRSNLFPSRKKGDRNRLLLDYISFMSYSHSSEHKAAVLALRNGALKSWESQAKFLLGFYPEKALDFLEKRPDKMLRMMAWLIRQGYKSEELEHCLIDKAQDLDPRVLAIILTEFGKEIHLDNLSDEKRKLVQQKLSEHWQVYTLAEKFFRIYLEKHPTPLDGKRVFMNMKSFDLEHSVIPRKHKYEEVNNIRRGLAYRIPEGINQVRFFITWESKGPISLHLDINGIDVGGKRYGNFERSYSSTRFGGFYNAESVDIDIRDFSGKVFLNLSTFGGYRRFKYLKSSRCGMIDIEQKKYVRKLYEKENCFYHHSLIGKFYSYSYGIVDTVNRCLFFDGCRVHPIFFLRRKKERKNYNLCIEPYSNFSLQRYLDLLFDVHGITITDDLETADMILTMSAPVSEKEISLIDNNFFL